MKDPNIDFSLDGKARYEQKISIGNRYAGYRFHQLCKKLNFSKTELRFHGKLVADVPTADLNYLNANIKLTDLLVDQKGQGDPAGYG